MTADLSARLAQRAAQSNLALSADLSSRLVAYLELLFRWNQKINLTALADPDEAIDRLVLEPIAAASHLNAGGSLADLGSGGGSPAIPLALALQSSSVLMVESKSRKAAFLREAARTLEINADVRAARFQEVARDEALKSAFDLVSVRALRIDLETLEAAEALLRLEGIVALFRSETQALDVGRAFSIEETVLIGGRSSSLVLLRHAR